MAVEILKAPQLQLIADNMKNWDESLLRHSVATADLSRKVAEVSGFSMPEINTVYLGAFLHDLGKVCWPRYLLTKKHLNIKDWDIVHTHPLVGVSCIQEYINNIDLKVLRIIGEHHEKPDGLGYPKGLKNSEIHPYSRLVAAVECFVALTEKRYYREKSFSAEDAIDTAHKCGFDPGTLDVVKSIYEQRKKEILSAGTNSQVKVFW